MNYSIVSASHRINSYLRSGELQDISSTLYSVACVSIGYTIAICYVLTMWAIDTLLTPHFDNSWSPEEWELSPTHTAAEPIKVTPEPIVAKRLTECLESTIETAKKVRKPESFKLATTPRNQRFTHDQIVAVGLELCDLPDKRTY